MSKTRSNVVSGRIDSDLSAMTIFELLANERRLLALRYLAQSVGAVTVGELGDQIALLEGEHTQEQYERICTSLVHIHLPKLADAGVIRYSAERGTIDLRKAADQINPYLELARPVKNTVE